MPSLIPALRPPMPTMVLERALPRARHAARPCPGGGPLRFGDRGDRSGRAGSGGTAGPLLHAPRAGRSERFQLARHASTIDLNRREFHEADASPFSASWAVTTDGAVVWSTDLVEYRVRSHDPDEDDTKVLCRPDYRPLVRSDARREEADRPVTVEVFTMRAADHTDGS